MHPVPNLLGQLGTSGITQAHNFSEIVKGFAIISFADFNNFYQSRLYLIKVRLYDVYILDLPANQIVCCCCVYLRCFHLVCYWILSDCAYTRLHRPAIKEPV